jgi:hypothetical protein
MEDEISKACGAHGEMTNAYKVSVGRSEGGDRSKDLAVNESLHENAP